MVKFFIIVLIFVNFSSFSNDKIEINADQFTYDKDNTRIYATGNVEILDSEFKLFAEKVFVNRKNNTYGSIFQIVGDAASQIQFFLTDSLNHFIFGTLYFYKKPNYDSMLPAINYVGNDISKLMESLKWTD